MSNGLQTEVIVRSKVYNPETGRQSRTFTFAGVVDAIPEDRLKIIDYKGTDDPLKFIHEQAISFQPELYALALRERGIHIQEVEYRLIVRPAISYKKPVYTYAVMREGRKTAIKTFKEDEDGAVSFASHLRAIGDRDDPPSIRVDERHTGNATRQNFEDECVEWLAQDGKLVTYHYFITSSRLKAAQEFLWDCSKRILECRRDNRWLPNSYACYAWGRECTYLPLCRAEVEGHHVEDVIADEYIQIGDPHPEIDEPTDNNVLTHSALKALTLCEVFYGRCYEQGLRKRSSYSEALWIGSAMHRGVEALPEGGMEAAFSAIDVWSFENPVLGEDAHHKKEQDIAKSRAMVRAAAAKWNIGENEVPPVSDVPTERIAETSAPGDIAF